MMPKVLFIIFLYFNFFMLVPYIPFVEAIFESLEVIYLNLRFLLINVFKTMFTLYHIAVPSVTNCISDRVFVHT